MAGLAWAGSRTTGRISEIAVLAPIRRGTPPGERRSYEERVRLYIASLSDRHVRGVPTGLGLVPAIHFGRFIILRPEQYLAYSELRDCLEYEKFGREADAPGPSRPKLIDAFEELVENGGETKTPTLASWLLTLVEFDGDLRGYMRDVATGFSVDFDLLFENCEEYPGTEDIESWWLWIKRFQLGTDLLYAPYRNLTVTRLKELERFKARFDAFVAQVRTPAGSRVRNIDDLFDAFLRENEQIAADFPSPGGQFPPARTDGAS